VRNQAVVRCFDLNNGLLVCMCSPKQEEFLSTAASFSLVLDSTFNVSNDASIHLTQVVTRSSVQLAYTPVFFALHTAMDGMAYSRILQQLFRCTGGVPGENSRFLGMTVDFDDALLVGYVHAYLVVSGRLSPDSMAPSLSNMLDAHPESCARALDHVRGCFFHFQTSLYKLAPPGVKDKASAAGRTLRQEAEHAGINSENFRDAQTGLMNLLAPVEHFESWKNWWFRHDDGIHWKMLFDIGPGTTRRRLEKTSNAVESHHRVLKHDESISKRAIPDVLDRMLRYISETDGRRGRAFSGQRFQHGQRKSVSRPVGSALQRAPSSASDLLSIKNGRHRRQPVSRQQPLLTKGWPTPEPSPRINGFFDAMFQLSFVLVRHLETLNTWPVLTEPPRATRSGTTMSQQLRSKLRSVVAVVCESGFSSSALSSSLRAFAEQVARMSGVQLVDASCAAHNKVLLSLLSALDGEQAILPLPLTKSGTPRQNGIRDALAKLSEPRNVVVVGTGAVVDDRRGVTRSLTAGSLAAVRTPQRVVLPGPGGEPLVEYVLVAVISRGSPDAHSVDLLVDPTGVNPLSTADGTVRCGAYRFRCSSRNGKKASRLELLADEAVLSVRASARCITVYLVYARIGGDVPGVARGCVPHPSTNSERSTDLERRPTSVGPDASASDSDDDSEELLRPHLWVETVNSSQQGARRSAGDEASTDDELTGSTDSVTRTGVSAHFAGVPVRAVLDDNAHVVNVEALVPSMEDNAVLPEGVDDSSDAELTVVSLPRRSRRFENAATAKYRIDGPSVSYFADTPVAQVLPAWDANSCAYDAEIMLVMHAVTLLDRASMLPSRRLARCSSVKAESSTWLWSRCWSVLEEIRVLMSSSCPRTMSERRTSLSELRDEFRRLTAGRLHNKEIGEFAGCADAVNMLFGAMTDFYYNCRIDNLPSFAALCPVVTEPNELMDDPAAFFKVYATKFSDRFPGHTPLVLLTELTPHQWPPAARARGSELHRFFLSSRWRITSIGSRELSMRQRLISALICWNPTEAQPGMRQGRTSLTA